MDLDKFVLEISKRPELYDSNNVKYKDKKLKEDINQEVGILFDTSDEVKHVFRIFFTISLC